jgi:SynChlorMet cassette protein ScmD
MSHNNKPVSNPLIVLREEFDDWAVLFDPDSGDGYGLNPVSVFIWKRLDGQHTTESILSELRENCEDVPDEAGDHINQFVQELVACGFAGHELKT